MATQLEGTASGKDAIQRVRYTHDAMIDLILQQPMIDQNNIAAYFGYSVGWVSRVIGSDAFQARLALRKTEVVDPAIIASMEDRLRGLAYQSMDIIQKKLDATGSADIALKTLELSTKALGLGARPANVATQNNTFVVAMPQKATDEKEWAAGAQASAKALSTPRAPPADVVDVEPREAAK